jgi:uncharacterized membrane protein YeaQ/YmgE (transglycosylase-associated protein family)
MGFLSWILVGLVAGILAKLIMPGRDPGGIVVTVLIGVAGAFVGGFLGSLVGIGSISGFNLPTLFTAVAGGVIVLFVYRQLRG